MPAQPPNPRPRRTTQALAVLGRATAVALGLSYYTFDDADYLSVEGKYRFYPSGEAPQVFCIQWKRSCSNGSSPSCSGSLRPDAAVPCRVGIIPRGSEPQAAHSPTTSSGQELGYPPRFARV